MSEQPDEIISDFVQLLKGAIEPAESLKEEIKLQLAPVLCFMSGLREDMDSLISGQALLSDKLRASIDEVSRLQVNVSKVQSDIKDLPNFRKQFDFIKSCVDDLYKSADAVETLKLRLEDANKVSADLRQMVNLNAKDIEEESKLSQDRSQALGTAIKDLRNIKDEVRQNMLESIKSLNSSMEALKEEVPQRLGKFEVSLIASKKELDRNDRLHADGIKEIGADLKASHGLIFERQNLIKDELKELARDHGNKIAEAQFYRKQLSVFNQKLEDCSADIKRLWLELEK